MSRRNRRKICLKPLLGSSQSSRMCSSTEQPQDPALQPPLAQLEMEIPAFLEHRNVISEQDPEDRKKMPFRWCLYLAMTDHQKHWMGTQAEAWWEEPPAPLTNPFLYYYFVIYFLLVGSTATLGDVEHVPACCWHLWDGRVRVIRSLHMLFPCSSA